MSEARKRLEKWMGRRPQVNGRRACSALMVLALGLLFSLSATLTEAQAQGPITRCQPEHAYGLVGGEAVVCIYVQDVVGLYGVDVELSFPDMLTPDIATVVDQDSTTPGVQIARSYAWVPASWSVFFNEADNSTGYLHYLTYGWNPAPAVDGSGPVACVRFLGSGVGTFTLSFARHDLSDRNGFLIDNTAHTCAVTFGDPTSVVVSRFEAQPVTRAIHIQWETAQEIDILGFNLYRASTATGRRIKLNQELIPTKMPPGSMSGATYDWMDRVTLRPGRTFFYWVETVDSHGLATLHEPIRVDVEDVAVD